MKITENSAKRVKELQNSTSTPYSLAINTQRFLKPGDTLFVQAYELKLVPKNSVPTEEFGDLGKKIITDETTIDSLEASGNIRNYNSVVDVQYINPKTGKQESGGTLNQADFDFELGLVLKVTQNQPVNGSPRITVTQVTETEQVEKAKTALSAIVN